MDAVADGSIPNAEVKVVISSRHGVYGLERAEKNGIVNMVIDRHDPVKLSKTLEEFNVDGIILAGYLSLLPPDVVKTYTGKIINIHPALLPMFGGKGFYGIKVHQAALASGVKYTGATAHLVDHEYDTGPALVRGVVPVLADDTAESLQKRVLAVEHRVLVQAVKALVEDRIEDLIKKPIILVDDKDKEGVLEFAHGLIELGKTLTGRTKYKMKILVIGSGGREHALGWKLKQSPGIELFFAPGNGGTAELGKNIDIKVDDIKKLADFAEENYVNLTVVGPELPLTLGVTNEFKRRALRIFGPSIEGAKLEGSKAYAKQFMKKYGIPTAEYDTVNNLDDGLKLLKERKYPLVIKADGLAAGKGVIICKSEAEAESTLRDMLDVGVFGEAGSTVVIEEFLTGKEVSLLCFTDGETIVPMETASDYKRALDNDMGPNTGGMGSISPSPYYTPGLGDDIALKTLEGIKKEGFDYRGVIYIGLILTIDGPRVLEYNARFGDPETEALLPRLETDFVDIIEAVVEKRLSKCELRWSDNKAVCVVLTSEGYPGEYVTGFPIDVPSTKSIVFHAGTAINNNETVTSGGRVLAVTALGTSFEEARKVVYDDIENIRFQGKTFRSDIGEQAR